MIVTRQMPLQPPPGKLPVAKGRPMILRRGRDRTANPTVLQLTPWLEANEAGLATLDVVRALKAFGWRAVVASAGGQLERELRLAGAEVAPIPFDTSGPLRDWQNSRAVMRLMRQRRVSLVHARSPLTGAVAIDVARRAGVPAVITPHRLPEAVGRRDAAWRASLASAGQVIATSEFAAEQLVTGLGLDAAKVRPVPRWIDLEEFHPGHVRGHRVAAAAERCGITVGPRVVGVPIEIAAERWPGSPHGRGGRSSRGRISSCSSWVPCPRHAMRCRSWRPPWRRRAWRSGPASAPASSTCRRHWPRSTSSWCRPPGLPPRRPWPRRPRPWAKPVIVTAVGALPELMMPAMTGWLLPPDDPGEIAWALELALRMDEDVRERVACRARQFIAESFEAETILERQLGLYAELLGMAPPVRATATRAAAA